jgi:hypothetical protein
MLQTRHPNGASEVLEHLQKFSPVGARTGHLFAECPAARGRLQLPKLGITLTLSKINHYRLVD